MGYTTKFSGHIALSRKLTLHEAKLLLEFSEDSDAIPGSHPQGYLQWVPSFDLESIVWDGNEKFYDYVEWLQWMVGHLAELEISAHGELIWSGESTEDTGRIVVSDGAIQCMKFTDVTYKSPLTNRLLNELAFEALPK